MSAGTQKSPIPLFLLLIAIVVSDLIAKFQRWKYVSKQIILYILLTFIGLLSLSGLFLKLPFQSKNYSYSSIIFKKPTLSAFLFLHGEPDLSAVLNIGSKWFVTGGYYCLHRNIPIYYPEQMQNIKPKNYFLYVSHIMCSKNQKAIPNFVAVFRSGDIEIRKSINSPYQYKNLNLDAINIIQPGIDGESFNKYKNFYPNKKDKPVWFTT